MFIITGKLNRKKTLFIAAAALLILAVILATVLGKDDASSAAALRSVVRDNDERVEYLTALGWQVEEQPMETQSIQIPRQMTETYAAYERLQSEQGFDLTAYGGLTATRYTYRILNYPGAGSDDSIVADLVIYRNEVIAGDVQSTRLDGFMHGLAYPGGR